MDTVAATEQLVFVYGTLRRGERNHVLLKPARYVCEHRTAPRYHLWHCGAYPAVSPGGRTAIQGELYSVGQRLMPVLDRLEDVPRLYQRHRIITPQGKAWIYMVRKRPPGAESMPTGDWCAARGQGHA